MLNNEKVRISVPFESLVQCVGELDIRDKYHLWLLLEKELAQAEEDVLEADPAVRAEIQEARAAFKAGDSITIDEYMARNGESDG